MPTHLQSELDRIEHEPLTGRLRVICGWCGAYLRDVPCIPESNGMVSHGLCRDCMKKQLEQIKANEDQQAI